MSEVQFGGLKGNYGFYQKDNVKPQEKEAAKETQKAPEKTESANPEKVLDALNLMGAQNFAQVQGKLSVNPAKYLSDERISSIEASMADFEKGVNKYAEAIEAEFGSAFSEDTKLALAANAFALNG